MTAQRWNVSDLEIAKLFDLDIDLVDQLLMRPIVPHVVQTEAEAGLSG